MSDRETASFSSFGAALARTTWLLLDLWPVQDLRFPVETFQTTPLQGAEPGSTTCGANIVARCCNLRADVLCQQLEPLKDHLPIINILKQEGQIDAENHSPAYLPLCRTTEIYPAHG